MLINIIQQFYNNQIVTFPPYLGDFPENFPFELRDILKVSNGVQEKTKNICISPRWIIFPYELILINSQFYGDKYGLKDTYIISIDELRNLILIVDSHKIISLEPTTGKMQTVAGSLSQYWTSIEKDGSPVISNEQRACLLIKEFGTDFTKIDKKRIHNLINTEIASYNDGSSDYIRILCGYLFCTGDSSDIPLIKKAKYEINMDVGCMIDIEWIDSLENNGAASKWTPTRECLIARFLDEIRQYTL